MKPTSESEDSLRKRQAPSQGCPSSSSAESCLRLGDRPYVNYATLSVPRSSTNVSALSTLAARFDPGRLYITANAARTLPDTEVLNALTRHATGDWGLLDTHDRQQNERALRQGGRLFSVYQTSSGQRFYVITESSRDLTTVLLPEDY